jgi:hypothetical protein
MIRQLDRPDARHADGAERSFHLINGGAAIRQIPGLR